MGLILDVFVEQGRGVPRLGGRGWPFERL